MRKYAVAACALACILLSAPTSARAGYFASGGQFVGTVSPQITALLAQFPAGGPGLRAAVARAVEIDPSLADDVVFAARSANPSQKLAVGEGLADAASFFGKLGSPSARAAQQQIQSALAFADAGIQAGVTASNTQAQAFTQTLPGFNNTGVTTGGCSGPTISPSRPPGC